jgi:hypothetical protein
MMKSYTAAPITDDEWQAFAGASPWRNKNGVTVCIDGKVASELRPLYRVVTDATVIIAGSEGVEVYTTDENGDPQSWALQVAFPNQASCKLFVDAIQGLEHVKSLGFDQVL